MPLMSIATSAAAFALTSKIATLAPASASIRAVAAPSPDAPPVTIAACPRMSMVGSLVLFWLAVGDDDVGGRRVGVEVFNQPRAICKYRALVDGTLVGHLADVERRQFGEQDGAANAARRAAARLQQASASGNTSAVMSSRSPPASTTSRTSGAKCAMNAARSGPTLTQVPVASLKSSARRPSNSRPFDGSAGSANLTASPIL